VGRAGKVWVPLIAYKHHGRGHGNPKTTAQGNCFAKQLCCALRVSSRLVDDPTRDQASPRTHLSLTSTPMAPLLSVDPALLSRVNAAITAIRAGRMVILVDDEDRENEGDLTMAAQFCSPEAVNFMATWGRGLICVTLTEAQIQRLNLPMMTSPGRRTPPLGTAFTVSIEAKTGVTTGISAFDRALTMRKAADPLCSADDVVTPGHVFPLRARDGGVLVRTGQTEGSVDLARLAGLTPAGVICEIMNDDGTMARMGDLELFAKKHDLLIVTVADLIQFRLQSERLVTRVRSETVQLDRTRTEWTVHIYEAQPHGRQFVALQKGEIIADAPTLCRVHSGSTIADLFVSSARDGGQRLHDAISKIEAEGNGILVYLPSQRTPDEELRALGLSRGGAAAPEAPSNDHPLREFGLGAQLLSDLGARKLRLLTNNKRKIAGLAAFGLEIVEHLPLSPSSV
jgi:3,4-dihydroxy 2-butanone 4-phosphate synthase / GTP cyclohydrolase II